MSAPNFSYSLSSTLYIQSSRSPCQLTLSTTSVSLVRSLSCCSCVISVAFSLVSASALTHHCPQPSSQSDPITRCQKTSLSCTEPSRGFQLRPRGASRDPVTCPSSLTPSPAAWRPGCPQHTQACSRPCLRAFVLGALSASEVISSDSLFPNLLQAFALISPAAFFDRLFRRTRRLLLLFCPCLIFLHSTASHRACVRA